MTPRAAQWSFCSNHCLVLVISPHTANCKWGRNNVQPDLTFLKKCIFLKSYTVFPLSESCKPWSVMMRQQNRKGKDFRISGSGCFHLARMSRGISLKRKLLRRQKLLSVNLRKDRPVIGLPWGMHPRKAELCCCQQPLPLCEQSPHSHCSLTPTNPCQAGQNWLCWPFVLRLKDTKSAVYPNLV